MSDDDIVRHTVHTDALDTLGSIIGPEEARDAIHLAVEPVEAGQTLLPGNHVRFNEMGEAVAADLGRGVGIVDPFLTGVVGKGERFWLVVYPRQITSLRHVWEHPDFPASDGMGPKAKSERWLRDYCLNGGYDVPSFDTLVRCARDYIETGETEEYLHIGGEDASGSIDPLMWDHLQNYLGLRAERKPEYFSCAC